MSRRAAFLLVLSLLLPAPLQAQQDPDAKPLNMRQLLSDQIRAEKKAQAEAEIGTEIRRMDAMEAGIAALAGAGYQSIDRADLDGKRAAIAARRAYLRDCLAEGTATDCVDDGRLAVIAPDLAPEPPPAFAPVSLNNGAERGVFAPTSLQAETSAVTPAPDAYGRQLFRIGIYGHNVDTEMGRLFQYLAEHAPVLLRPIPLNHDYARRVCLNGGFQPLIVDMDWRQADAAYTAMMLRSADLWDSGEERTRFILVQSQIAEMRRRTGVSGPEDLADFTVEQALELVTADFEQRHALAGRVPPDLVPALRNLWVVLGEDSFMEILDQVAPKPGTAVDRRAPRRQWSADGLWAELLTQIRSDLHCTDADKILKSYGLVYRQGDYPTARRTLDLLEDYMGVEAVPGIAMRYSSHLFTEAKRQNCRVFGPIEDSLSGADPDSCHLDMMKVKNGDRWVVLGGGVQLEFLVTPRERDLLLGAMKKIAADRQGDILRWSHDGSRPLVPQASARAAGSRPAVAPLACAPGGAERITQLTKHVGEYKKRFYPTSVKVAPEQLAPIFVIDRSEHDELATEILGWNSQDVQDSMINSLATLQQQVEQEPDAGDAGLSQLPQTGISDAIARLCAKLASQFDIEAVTQASHGEFILSLLYGKGAHSPELSGIGLLNSDGGIPEEELRLDDFFANGGTPERMPSVIDEFFQKMVSVQKTNKDVSGELPSAAIVNMSLGLDYGMSHDKAGDDLLRQVRRATSMLFVFAAGQPDSVSAAAEGTKLVAVSPNEIDLVSSSGCRFMPACLSGFANAVTVGAIGPTAGAIDPYHPPTVAKWSNYGPAVTLAAPGEGILGNSLRYLSQPNEHGGQDLLKLPVSDVRSGTSAAAVFVTALAAKMASSHTDMTPQRIKTRLIGTAQPYLRPDGAPEFYAGEDGLVYAGVIDPGIALLPPEYDYVKFRGQPDLVAFEDIDLTDAAREDSDRRFYLFPDDSAAAKRHFQCPWKDLTRLHVTEVLSLSEQRPNATNFLMAAACNANEWLEPKGKSLASGYAGTANIQQHPCLTRDDCLIGIRKGSATQVPLKLQDVEDIYFGVE